MTTIGDARLRVGLNPETIELVDDLERCTARLIDVCESLKAKDGRLASLAQTAYEEAVMWATKAATTRE